MRNSKLRKQIDACFLAVSFSLKRITGRPFLLRLTALATCLFFTTTNVTWGQPAGAILEDIPRIAIGLDDLKIPEDMGSIQFTHQEADTDKFVLYVQDAHGIFDAQENIRRMIEYFREKYGVEAVAVEGSKGGLDPTLLRSFPDDFVKKKVMNQYKELGELSGADMAAILNPKPSRFYGIEDWRLYEENFAAYVAADENREEINKKIEALKHALDQKRPQIFSVPLNRFHEKTDAFHEEKSGMFELLKYLVEVESRTEPGRKHITSSRSASRSCRQG